MKKDINAVDIENMLKGKLSLDDLDNVNGGFDGSMLNITDEEIHKLDPEDVNNIDGLDPRGIIALIKIYKYNGFPKEEVLEVSRSNNPGIASYIDKYWDRY